MRALAERLRADGLRVWLGDWEIRPGDLREIEWVCVIAHVILCLRHSAAVWFKKPASSPIELSEPIFSFAPATLRCSLPRDAVVFNGAVQVLLRERLQIQRHATALEVKLAGYFRADSKSAVTPHTGMQQLLILTRATQSRHSIRGSFGLQPMQHFKPSAIVGRSGCLETSKVLKLRGSDRGGSSWCRSNHSSATR